MNPAKLVIGLVLALFVPYSLWVVATGGSPTEVLAAIASHRWTVQISLDLVLALAMVSVWIIGDARAHGRSALPWITATLFLGSIAPLLYLLLRTSDSATTEATVRARA